MIGGIGRLVGAMTGGGGYGIMPGRLTSSTTRGSLPWSNGQRSPRTQNPFSVNEKGNTKNSNSTLSLKNYKQLTLSHHLIVFETKNTKIKMTERNHKNLK